MTSMAGGWIAHVVSLRFAPLPYRALPMQFEPPLTPGRLLKRYKRFLADVELESGEIVTAHCANPGSMLGLAVPGQRIWLQKSTNPKRKLAYSWLLEDLGAGAFAGIDTGIPNRLVKEALQSAALPDFAEYPEILPEQKIRRELPYRFPVAWRAGTGRLCRGKKRPSSSHRHARRVSGQRDKARRKTSR